MKEIKEEKKIFVETCSHCGKDIRGNSTDQCLYNLSVHIRQKHGKKKKPFGKWNKQVLNAFGYTEKDVQK